MTIKLYGIANCDTVKRARAWLAARDADVVFHDFKKSGLAAERLDAWIDRVGWEPLLNRRGATWRKLDDAERASVIDAATARRVMLSSTSVVKRPVVEWEDGSLTIGFDPDSWEARLAAV